MGLAGVARTSVTLWVLGTWGATGWTLAQNPFAAPVVARGAAEVRAVLSAAVARQAGQDWLAAEIEGALATDDTADLALLLAIAEAQGAALPPDLEAVAREAVGDGQGFLADAAACGRCAFDITACTTVAQIGACAVPVELSPLGDVNALVRAGSAVAAGEEVDRVEVGLAVLGLVATGAILVSGGSSASVKAGASLLRTARRMGALSPSLTTAFADAASGLVLWDRLPAVALGAPVAGALDAAKAGRLAALAEDVGRLRAATSTAETLVLLRHAETAEDLARLARLAEAAGPETRAALRVLGPARAFRALDRASGLALAALGLVGLVAAQVGAFVAGLVLRAATPARPARESALASAPRLRR